MTSPYLQLPPTDPKTDTLNVIIETPKGSRNKFSFDEKLLLFKFKNVLPEGSFFPFDFGFLPNTLAEDGDPLDVLLLMDEPVFTGCLVEARAIGVIEAEQTEDGNTVRNDRLLAVSENVRMHKGIKTLHDLPKPLLEEIEHFFKAYNEGMGREFKVVGKHGPPQALKLIRKAAEAYQKKS
ncbi:inorganic diphosphatase [Adhaeribacter soli]|uniref:inorganic diphosphatase n=1 Tax=Adhaeribacter soli TaxID=2607655 RepID=A0A5N1IUJ0_9BACT|nr:inorganic diphosphatase [Adhaeribacter soli]KAA9333724.1 inorganic diphosphatase [Adhaeribacter soli]